MAGRGLRACCFAARPGATLSFKEAPDAAQQQPQAAHHSASSSSSLDDVLGLLPADGPQKDEAAPPVASKASFCHEIAEERIPAGTYIAAAVAAVAPAAEQHETAEPWPDAALPERSSHAAEEADRDALPLSTAEQDSTQQFASPDEQASLEAAVGAALGLPMPAACNVSASRARPAASGASGCSMSASHLSLELQVAEALGDLHPAAGTADCLALQAPGGEGGLARCCSGSGSTAGLSSPWRTSTSSFGAEPEASKRFSCCGSACPVLETIRESISTQEQSSVSLAAAPSCPTFAGDAGGALTDEPGAAAASERQQPQDEQLAGSCTEGAADIGDEVAALLGGMLPGPAPTSLTWPGEAATQQSTLTNILALLGQPQESSSPSQPAAGGATCPAPEDGFDAAICQLLLGGGSEEQVAVPAAEAAARPVSAGAMQAGRLASLSQGSEAGWREAEAHPPAAFPPPAAAAAAAVATLPADEAADWPAGGDGSAPAEECSSSSGTSGSAALAGCTAACTALAASVTRPADLPLFGNAPPIIPCTRAPPSWSSDGGEGADPLASMHDRAVRQRREAEHMHARLRQQREAEELGACTFRPKLLTGSHSHSPSRPGSTASLGTAGGIAGGSASFGQAAGIAMYARQQAQRQRQLERLEAQRAEQERDALAPCTFRPAVDPQSQRMFARGVRYGGSRVVAGGSSVDEAVHRQLRLLHSAGLNAAAAAAVLAGQGLVSADAELAEPEQGAAVIGGQAVQPEPAEEGLPARNIAHPGDLSGAAIPSVLQSAATSPTRRQLSAASRTAGALLSPAKAGRPLSASARLYAHAVDLQGRQRQAAALRDQEQRAALLAASPKAKPFPRAQHTNPPSPPLSRRSPPVSRPGSAPPPGLLCASLEQAAVQVELAGLGGLAAGELGGRAHQAAGRAPERSTTGKAASYWQRWGLEAGPDFDGFLQRQEKFVQALGAKLDAERHLPAAQQAAAAAPGAHLSPGSRRLLERRRQRELALEMEAAGCMRASMAGCDAAGDHSTHSSPLHHSGAFGHAGLEGTGACQSASMAGSVPAPAPSAFPYRPVITSRAAAKPARTPEELHAEAARRQAKLAQRRREAEQAALAPCTFAPDIAPAAGSPLSAEFAGKAKGRIDLQDLGAYMREVGEKQAAREEAAAAAAKARQEQELAQCTFQPNLGHGQRSPQAAKRSGPGEAAKRSGPGEAAKRSGPGEAAAAGAAPAALHGTSSGLAVKAAQPPDVLAQVQALLRGDSTAEAAATCAIAAPGGVGTTQQVAAAGDGVPAAAGVPPGAGQAGAGADSFSAFLSQVTAELRRLQDG